MAEQTAAQEPTMEEILASIRRIISEDEPGAASPTASAIGAEEGDDVLELTDPLGGDDDITPTMAAEPEPMVRAAPSPATATHIETQGDLEILPAPKPRKPAPKPPARREPEPMFDADEDSLTSAPVAASVTSAFGQLARNAAMPAAGRSIEDVMREMLRPMLREWLDQHLPDIVEARVRAEVERLSRGG